MSENNLENPVVLPGSLQANRLSKQLMRKLLDIKPT
jgi:hypothetical protein